MRGSWLNSFYEAYIALIAKYDKDITKNKITYQYASQGFPQEYKVNIFFKNNVIHYINSIKEKNCIIISVDTKKVFDKIQNQFIFQKTRNTQIDKAHL